MRDKPPRTWTDHLANERTFLAWIRTSIGIMAFGFVVERFSLFSKQLMAVFTKEPSPEQYSPILGVALVGLGALFGLLAYLKFIRVERQIEEGGYRPANKLALAVTILTFGMGLFLLLYLIV